MQISLKDYLIAKQKKTTKKHNRCICLVKNPMQFGKPEDVVVLYNGEHNDIVVVAPTTPINSFPFLKRYVI